MGVTLNAAKQALLSRGTVIPAHPLALNAARELDETRQRGLTRYYIDAGVGGLAVGVHSTQFEIREHGLYERVMSLAIDEARSAKALDRLLMVGGVIGPTDQAIREANLCRDMGYDIALVGLGALADWSEDALVEHMKAVAQVLPVCGFYLQPSVGGRHLSHEFWRQVADIDGVVAIKIAPFDRYATQDVVRAVIESSRCDDVTLYTGNDDNIVADLLTPFRFKVEGEWREKRIVGGLLGHWGVWTKSAVLLLDRCQKAIASGVADELKELLALGVAVTDMNAAVFDPAHQFAGCIPGIHEVLRREGLLDGIWCLNEDEVLSPGQAEEITRVIEAYPELSQGG